MSDSSPNFTSKSIFHGTGYYPKISISLSNPIKMDLTFIGTKSFMKLINNKNSQFFYIPNRQTETISDISSLFSKNIVHFLVAFDRTYKVNLTSSSFCSSFCKLVIFYCVFYRAHSSEFIRYIVRETKFIRIPLFMHLVLHKISMPVESPNRSIGLVCGESRTSESLSDIFDSLQSSLHDGSFYQGFKDTNFSKVFTNPNTQRECTYLFKSMLDQFDKDYSGSVDLEFEYVLHISSSISDTLRYPDKFPTFSGVIKSYVSPHLGIYRFRNSVQPGVYHTQQYSLETVSFETIEHMVCYLYLFRPEYYQGSAHEQVTTLLPCDVEISFGNVSTVEFFLKYLSYSSPPTRPISGKGDNNVKDRTVNPDTGDLDLATGSDSIAKLLYESEYTVSDNLICSYVPSTGALHFYTSNYRLSSNSYYINFSLGYEERNYA